MALKGAVVVLVLFFCSLALYAVTICGSCGYENSDDAIFCSHCGFRLKGARKSESARGVDKGAKGGEAQEGLSAAVNTNRPAALIETDIVKREMRLASGYADQGRWVLAILFARNARALNQLTAEKGRSERFRLIGEFLKKSRESAGHARYQCPDCGGTGIARLARHSMSGGVQESIATAGMRCKRCGGSGYIRGGLTVGERRQRIGVATEEYRTLQQNRGMQPVGLVMVPPGVADKLDVRARVALKRALPLYCPYCMGLGVTECKACHGRGVVPCRARGCVNGYVENDSRSSGTYRHLGSSSGNAMHSIGTKGVRHECPVCHGTGVVPCSKCDGKGSFVCRHCNGSGYADICKKCDGTGLLECRRCGGTGRYRGKECPQCHGEGVVECRSCGGTGRK